MASNVTVKFRTSGSNTQLGGFSPGDIATVQSDFAKHLVEEIGVADYHGTHAAQPKQPEPVKPKARVKKA